jgi:hypothetical protein
MRYIVTVAALILSTPCHAQGRNNRVPGCRFQSLVTTHVENIWPPFMAIRLEQAGS